MSADRQRLKSAIQRIAKEDPEIRNLLGEGKNKGGKASSAGVGTSEAEESRLCCDGSTSDNANPGTGERDPDSDSQDGLDSDDPAKLSSGDGTLSGVTDCATGEPICFDGSGFIPPEGWDGPSDGPVEYLPDDYDSLTEDQKEYLADLSDPDFHELDEQYGWRGEYNSSVYGRTLGEALSKMPSVNEDGSIVWSDGFFNNDGETGLTYQRTGTGVTSGGNAGGFGLVERIFCANYPGDDCGTEPEWPTADTWPEDGCTNLAIKGGTIVGSKFDPENDGSYSAPRDSIDLCDSEGNQISLAPSADGGWKTINSTTNNGYLYDSSGRQIAHIDGNEYSDPSM